MTDLAADVRRLADRFAITDLLHRYARGIDDFDGRLLSSCFTDDCRYAVGDRSIAGRATLSELFQNREGAREQTGLDTVEMYTHVISNIEIELDGESAHVTSMARAYVIGSRDGTRVMLVRCVRYTDRVVREASEWRIADRKHVLRWKFEVEPTVGAIPDQSNIAWTTTS